MFVQGIWNFVSTEGIAVSTIYGQAVEIYVVSGDESEFIDAFDPLAIVDVDEARTLLSKRFGHSAPDLVIEPPLTFEWLRSLETP